MQVGLQAAAPWLEGLFDGANQWVDVGYERPATGFLNLYVKDDSGGYRSKVYDFYPLTGLAPAGGSFKWKAPIKGFHELLQPLQQAASLSDPYELMVMLGKHKFIYVTHVDATFLFFYHFKHVSLYYTGHHFTKGFWVRGSTLAALCGDSFTIADICRV